MFPTRVLFIGCIVVVVIWSLVLWIRIGSSNNNNTGGGVGVGACEQDSCISFPRRRIALVLQYALQQWGLLKENLASWEHPKLFPCLKSGKKTTPMVDLVFYVSRDPRGEFQKVALQLAERSSWRSCFDRVLFKNCDLAHNEDVYGIGTVTMFYRMFSKRFVPGVERYTYAFLMEPDTRPVRLHWLDAMERQCASDSLFWQKGSVPRYKTSMDPLDLHINGNAFYRLNDVRSSRFFLSSSGAFLPYISFDQSIHAHRARVGMQDTQHLFQATEFIVNNWKDGQYYTVDGDVRKWLPDTYLMHGRQSVKAQCTYINCTDSWYGKMSKIGG